MSNTARFYGFINAVPTENSILNQVPYSSNRLGKKGVPATLRHMWAVGAPSKLMQSPKLDRLIRFDPMEEYVKNFHDFGTLLPFTPTKQGLLYLYKPTLAKNEQGIDTITLNAPVSFDEEPTGTWIVMEDGREVWKSDLYLVLPSYNVDPDPFRKGRVILGGFRRGNPLPLKAEVEFIIPAFVLSRIMFPSAFSKVSQLKVG